jgi:hypothetical protein
MLNKMTNDFIEKTWIEEFDEEFETKIGSKKTCEDIEKFIQSKLEEAYNEGLNLRKEYCDPTLIEEIKQANRREILKEVEEKLPKEQHNFNKGDDFEIAHIDAGFNKCLLGVKNIIRDLYAK